MNKRQNQLALILFNLRSTYNVGAIFRTADAVGISNIYLIGTTPKPIDDYDRINGQIAKTALGAEKTIPWEYRKTLLPLIKKLRKAEKNIIALEQDDGAIDYRKIKLKQDSVLILGEETRGLSKSILKQVDQIMEIPMVGEKESLNVSVAAGIATYCLLKP